MSLAALRRATGFFQPQPIAAGAVYEDTEMTIGLIGRKAGMTRVFTDAGESIPVTVIEALPNRVTQVKGVESDGYRAVQVTFGDRKPSRLTRAARRSLRQGQGRAGRVARRVPPRRRRRRRPRAGRRAQGRHVRRGPGRRRHRHHDRQGLRRHHQAPQLRGRPGLARRLVVPPHARLDRPAPDAGTRVPGQAHVRPHGQHAPHHREAADRRGRRRAQPAADPWRRAGRRRAAR